VRGTNTKWKTIILPNPSDNTFFAGYFAWKLDDWRGEEIPIRKSKHIFIKPNWANGYRVYTVNTSSIKVTDFLIPTEPEV